MDRFGLTEPFSKFFKFERNFHKIDWAETLELELIPPFRNSKFYMQAALPEGFLLGLLYGLLFFTIGLLSFQDVSMLYLLGVIGFTHGFIHSLMLDAWVMSYLYSAVIGTSLSIFLLFICHIMSASAGWGGLF